MAMVTIDAKPAPVPIDIAKTAVIVVDMQNDFGAPDGMCDTVSVCGAFKELCIRRARYADGNRSRLSVFELTAKLQERLPRLAPLAACAAP